MSIEQPYDQYGRFLPLSTPRGKALARTVKALTSSFLINLNSRTTYLRVYAIAKDVYLKWADNDEDYVSAEDFDEVIPAGEYIDLMPPIESDGSIYTRIMLVGRETGSTVIVIEK